MSVKMLSEIYPDLIVEYQKSLSHYTYTKTGGLADAIAFPRTIQEVQQLIQWAGRYNVPYTVLGNASNLIVRDGGIRGLVIILTKMNQITVDETKIYAQSGASLIETSHKAAEMSLSGLEFACGIPGSIGGAVFMNAGAYGGEVMDVIESVDFLTEDAQICTIKQSECHFGYRQSRFQSESNIILGTTFQLEKGDIEAIRSKMETLTIARQTKQPLEYPSCGSVFKRPEGYFTGKLIQDAGLQGYRIGGAEVSKKHAGFIVNIDHATATDYINLIQFIQEKIWTLYHVELETEVKIIGETKE